MQISALLSRVHDEIPSAPELLALRALADSVKEFCARTFAWQGAVADVLLVPGVTTDYTLVPPPGTMIVAPLEVRVDGTLIGATPAAEQRLTRHSAGAPRSFAMVTPSVIEMDRPAAAGATVTVRAALTLPLGAIDTDVPDSIIDEHGEAIAAGAKMRLVRMAGQPWADPALTPAYYSTYYTAINLAKHRVMTSLGQADLRVEMNNW